MASLVFLIGNGFDLNCGLKSRYKDAYEYYLSKTVNDSETIQNFKKDLSANHENWSDFEIGISNYAQKLSNENELIECLRDFRKSLKEYLTIEESKFYDLINSTDGLINELNSETDNSIKTFYEGISNNISNNIRNIDIIDYITFNYTSILDNLTYYKVPRTGERSKYKLGCISNNVIHVHASCHNNTPVLGVDRIEQLTVSYSLTNRGKRTLIKPTFNSEVDKSRIESAKERIDNADYICAFGLSLGFSDLTWREKLISWLESTNWHQLFIYDYSVYDEIELEDDERLDMEEELKYKLFLDWGIETSSKLWNQIHMPCGNKIFNYKEVIDEYLHKKEIHATQGI